MVENENLLPCDFEILNQRIEIEKLIRHKNGKWLLKGKATLQVSLKGDNRFILIEKQKFSLKGKQIGKKSRSKTK